VELSPADRLRVKLLALDLRLHELTEEARGAQLDLARLERAAQDRRMAALLGQEAEAAGEIQPRLQATRARLHSRLAVIESAKQSRWQTRVRLVVARIRELRASPETGGEEAL